LAKIDQTKRRQIITVAIILSVALLGLMLVTTQRSSEHQSLYAGLGASTVAPDTAATATAPSYEGMVGRSVAAISIFKMLLALAVVIACIYGGIFLLKKMTGRKRTGAAGTNLLEVLETTYLDPKKSLSLVRVAGKSVLIGVTETQISVLTEFDQEHTNTLLASSAGKPQTESFGNILRSASVTLKGFGSRRDTSQ
jgi:flagellar biosynthetic protein FliO